MAGVAYLNESLLRKFWKALEQVQGFFPQLILHQAILKSERRKPMPRHLTTALLSAAR